MANTYLRKQPYCLWIFKILDAQGAKYHSQLSPPQVRCIQGGPKILLGPCNTNRGKDYWSPIIVLAAINFMLKAMEQRRLEQAAAAERQRQDMDRLLRDIQDRQHRVSITHKVHIYLEYHSVCLLVGFGTPNHSIASVSSPWNKGGADSPAGEGVGESQCRRLEEKPSTLSTLCITVK